jgi:hypothetical protein
MPSASRHRAAASTVTSSPSSSASSPPYQARPVISTPPATSGISGGRAPVTLSARTISQIPTPAASAMTPRKASRQTNSEASTTRIMLTPTAMAAGRLRPARPVFLAGLPSRPARRFPGPRGAFSAAVNSHSACEVEVAAGVATQGAGAGAEPLVVSCRYAAYGSDPSSGTPGPDGTSLARPPIGVCPPRGSRYDIRPRAAQLPCA